MSDMIRNKKAMEYTTDIVVGLVIIVIAVAILYIVSSFVGSSVETTSNEVYQDLEMKTVAMRTLEFPVMDNQRLVPVKYYIYESLDNEDKKKNLEYTLKKIVARRPDVTFTIMYKNREFLKVAGSLQTEDSYEYTNELPEIEGQLSIKVQKYV